MPLLKVDVVEYDSVNQIYIGSSQNTQCKEITKISFGISWSWTGTKHNLLSSNVKL